MWTAIIIVVCLWMIFVYVPWDQREKFPLPDRENTIPVPQRPSEVSTYVSNDSIHYSDYSPCGNHTPTGREDDFNEVFSSVQEDLRDSSRYESPDVCYDRLPDK